MAQGWSLNPGRYVGVAEREADDGDWREKLEELNEELEVLNAEAREWRGESGRMWWGCWRGLSDDPCSYHPVAWKSPQSGEP